MVSHCPSAPDRRTTDNCLPAKVAQARQVAKRRFKHQKIKTAIKLLKKASESPSKKVSNDRSD